MNSNTSNCGYNFLAILIIAMLINDGFWLVNACDLDQAQNGCRIDNGACSCSYGCKSEYRYKSLKECNDALKGRSGDICSRDPPPCMNRGVCVQVTQSPGYRCGCDGTGYWGNRCQRKCPNSNDFFQGEYPHQCIVI